MDFIDDDEKMRDFFLLTKEEFLKSYSYLKEEDYDATKELVKIRNILEVVYEGKDSWDRPVYKDKNGVLYKDIDLGEGNNLQSSLCTATNNKFEGEPLAPIDKNIIVKVIRYVPVKQIRGNEDLHKIAKQINFETDDSLMPEDTKRDVFLRELETEIKWELDMVSPSVSKEVLCNAYKELSEIKCKEISSFKEKVENFLQNSTEYKNFNVNYILIDNKKLGNSTIIASDNDEMIQINPYNMDIKNIMDWAYNFDEDIFDELERGKKIDYMTMNVHYAIWNSLNELYPEDINYKDGVQLYIQYCKDNNITKEYLEEKLGLKVQDIMHYYESKNIETDEKIYGNLKIVEQGYRKEEPVALIEESIGNDKKEYIIAFHFKTENEKLSWEYGYYYDNDKEKAKKDYKEVISGGNIADTFNKKSKNKNRER